VKRAYLTIDDAPSRDFTAKVDYLYQNNIPAIFFCVGEFIKPHLPAVQYAIQRGFLIGNHSYHHHYFSDLSLDDCKREIRDTDDLIHQVYSSLGLERPARYFRFPHFDTGGDASGQSYEAKWSCPRSDWFQYEFAAKRSTLQQYLQDLGYRQPAFEGVNLRYSDDSNLLAGADVRCTFDQAEYWLDNPEAPWGLSSEEAILARIDEDCPYEGRSLNRLDTVDIILVHDHENTTKLFYRIIARYIEKGIRLLPIP
jgi:peptidoglycan-N-acetylglucosamine deacetylase